MRRSAPGDEGAASNLSILSSRNLRRVTIDHFTPSSLRLLLRQLVHAPPRHVQVREQRLLGLARIGGAELGYFQT